VSTVPSTEARPRVVVVTGVGRYLGARVAARLVADERIDRVIGLDTTEPSAGAGIPPPAGVEVHSADLRSTEPARIIAGSGADTVVHLAVVSATDPGRGGRAAMKEHNVIGTMQLLAACQHIARVRKVVIRSSTAAYGASFRDPAVFTEDTPPREIPRGGFARDVLDIEGYARGFRRRRPDVTTTILRFAPMIGPAASTSLTRYFDQPVVPTVLGRDPRLQFIHVDDALEILHRSVVEDHDGTYNVAGPGVLTLSQAVRRAGRVAVPVLEPGLSMSASVARVVSLDQLDLFVHGRVVDTSKLEAEFGFSPRPTPEAFADFLRGQRHGALLPRERVRAAERAILDQIRMTRRQLSGADG
jgi:UDP-glucose 4-epimerase